MYKRGIAQCSLIMVKSDDTLKCFQEWFLLLSWLWAFKIYEYFKINQTHVSIKNKIKMCYWGTSKFLKDICKNWSLMYKNGIAFHKLLLFPSSG